ncbi:hypothetical protein SAMN00120144_4388, partial [Hymenobacter roseosalivarius DSM 11622]
AASTLQITTATVTNASCTATGSIVVTAAGGIGAYSYQLNNGAFGTSNVFSDLAPGSYTLTVRDASGCSVTRSNVTILSVPSNLVLALSNLVNTDCTTSLGAVTLAASGGTAPYRYVLTNGTTELTNATGSFSGLRAGTYNVLVSDASGCTTTCTTIQVVINAAPTAPSAPVAVVVQPTCLVATGSLTVSSPIEGGTYTLVGVGVTLTSNTGVFTNLAPGAYSLKVSLNGCVSAAVAVTINAVPTAPAQPVVTLGQPTSLVATGSVTV